MTIKEFLSNVLNDKCLNEKEILIISNDEQILACHSAQHLFNASSNRIWGKKEVDKFIVRHYDIAVRLKK